jgi:hypothetical protein
MRKRILSVIMSLVIIMLPVHAYAQEAEGQAVSLEKGQLAPYSGILLDIPAAVKINTDKKYSLLEYELKLDLQLKKITAQHQLALGNLQARYDSLSERHTSILSIKDDEIARLQELVKDDPNDYTMWWFAGGTAIGIVLSVAIFYAAVETAR